MTLYIPVKTLRTTSSGAMFVKYRSVEDFGRDTGYAHSWGCRERRTQNLIWVRAGETLEDAIQRRDYDN